MGDTYTYYLLDGGDVVAEYTDNSLSAHYVRGINLIRGKFGSTTRYYLHDAHGDITALTNSSGTVTKRYSYDAFGNEVNPSSDANPFRYCGEYFDKETQTYYLRARYYDPAIGRFTQQDPIKHNLNWYVYCSCNPIGRIDPSGKMDYIYTSPNNYYTENDRGRLEPIIPDRYFVEVNGTRYRALSFETISLYVWDSIDEEFLEGTFLSLINTANQKDTGLLRILTQSVGGELDFKLQLDNNTLYLVGDTLYNSNEAGNFMWAYFLESHGFSWYFNETLAQAGSLLPPLAKMSGTPRLDEPWDQEARWAGVVYYYTRSNQEALFLYRYYVLPRLCMTYFFI